jgi:uncharacterized protein (TIGR02996 family)
VIRADRTCALCGLAFREANNRDHACSHHPGSLRDYDRVGALGIGAAGDWWSCCGQVIVDGAAQVGCSTQRHAAPAEPAPVDDPLLRAIYDDPDDDAPRAVYVDALLERGDRLGEALAAARAGDDRATAALWQLLPPGMQATRLAGGFPAAARCAPFDGSYHVDHPRQLALVSTLAHQLVAKTWGTVIGDPRMRTLDVLEFTARQWSPFGNWQREILLHEVTERIRELRGIQPQTFAALYADDVERRLERVTIDCSGATYAAIGANRPGLPLLREILLENVPKPPPSWVRRLETTVGTRVNIRIR